MDETDQNRLTEGSVPRTMLAFALPIFLSNLFQQLYNMVDSMASLRVAFNLDFPMRILNCFLQCSHIKTKDWPSVYFVSSKVI